MNLGVGLLTIVYDVWNDLVYMVKHSPGKEMEIYAAREHNTVHREVSRGIAPSFAASDSPLT